MLSSAHKFLIASILLLKTGIATAKLQFADSLLAFGFATVVGSAAVILGAPAIALTGSIAIGTAAGVYLLEWVEKDDQGNTVDSGHISITLNPDQPLIKPAGFSDPTPESNYEPIPPTPNHIEPIDKFAEIHPNKSDLSYSCPSYDPDCAKALNVLTVKDSLITVTTSNQSLHINRINDREFSIAKKQLDVVNNETQVIEMLLNINSEVKEVNESVQAGNTVGNFSYTGQYTQKGGSFTNEKLEEIFSIDGGMGGVKTNSGEGTSLAEGDFFKDFFNPFNNLNINTPAVGACPAASFSLLGQQYHFNHQCQIFEPYKPSLRAVFSIIWIVLSTGLVLRS